MKLIHIDIRKTKSYHIAPIFFKSKILSHYIQIHSGKLHLEKQKQNKSVGARGIIGKDYWYGKNI